MRVVANLCLGTGEPVFLSNPGIRYLKAAVRAVLESLLFPWRSKSLRTEALNLLLLHKYILAEVYLVGPAVLNPTH